MTEYTNNQDLKSHGELEKYMYGSDDAITYFQRNFTKCTAFNQETKIMDKSNGTPNFGYNFTVVVNKSGDFLNLCWLLLELPEISLKDDVPEEMRIRWTENLMHNLIEECNMTFNDTVIAKFDNYILDFNAEFNIDESKYNGYMNIIGNTPDFLKPTRKLKSKILSLPLPFFFSKDSGTAIPLTALPHTEIKINFKFRSWEHLLIMENSKNLETNISVPVVGKDIAEVPKILDAKIFCTYTIVSAEERAKIGSRPKLMVIEQFNMAPRQMVTTKSTRMDLLFNQSVKNLYFSVKNNTYKNVWSNYTYGNAIYKSEVFIPQTNELHPVESVSLNYNNKCKFEKFPAVYFNSIVPWYNCKRIPKKPGMFVYSYALNHDSIDPVGSTALCRVDNPYLTLNLTNETLDVLESGKETFELIVAAVTYNIIRISEGVITFPAI